MLGVLVVAVQQLAPSQLAEAVPEGVNRWGVGVHRAPARLGHQPPPPRHDPPDTHKLLILLHLHNSETRGSHLRLLTVILLSTYTLMIQQAGNLQQCAMKEWSAMDLFVCI